MTELLRYVDEHDKSLGLTGMAISLMACDGERYLAAVSLDDVDNSFEMAEEFFFVSNPRFSAKVAWSELLRQFQISTALVLGNVLCRAYSCGTTPDQDHISAAREIVGEQGHSYCDLDDDEIDNVFNKHYRYYSRLFSHPTVASTARDIADRLVERRTMSAGELFEALQRLNIL